MKNKTTTRKRILSLCMALSMVIGLIPFSAFAADDSLTVKTTYNATNDTDYTSEEITALTADNASTITLTIDANLSSSVTGNTIKIVIPAGIDLVSAPGYGTNNYNETQTGYFSGNPTFSTLGAISGVANNSGTLTYTLNAVSVVSFSIELEVNPAYVYTGYDPVTHYLGTVDVSLTDGDDSYDHSLAISTTSLDSDMKFTSLTATEVYPHSLLVSSSSPTENNLMVGCSDTVVLSAVFSKNLSMSGASYSMRANNIEFSLTVPTGAVVTVQTGYSITDTTINDDHTTTYRFYNIGSNFSNSNNVGTVSLKNFATVEFGGALYVAGQSHEITIGELTIFMDKYDVTLDTPAFTAVSFATIGDEGLSDTTVDVIAQTDTYNPGFSGATSNWEEIQPDNPVDLQLYAVKRGYMNSDSTSLDYFSPVKFTFEAIAQETDTTLDAYLDDVNKVVMNVPFIGDASTPRHIAQLLSLSVTYEGNEAPTVLDISNVASLYDDGAIGGYNDFNTIGTDNIILLASNDGDEVRNLYGYHNLGSASLTNATGTPMDDDETITITITGTPGGTTFNDIVKEVYFPLYATSNLDQVKALTVTSTDGSTSSSYLESWDVENACYVVGVNGSVETFGVVQIPDGKTFSSLRVTLETWGKDNTSGYVILRGYVADNDTLEVGDSYTISVSTTQDDIVDPAPITVNSTLTAPTSSGGNVVILGTKSYTVEAGTYDDQSVNATVLSPGLSTQVEFDLNLRMGRYLCIA